MRRERKTIKIFKKARFEFKSEKYPDLEFKVEYNYPEMYGSPYSKINRYEDELLSSINLRSNLISGNNKNFNYDKYANILKVKDFNKRGKFYKTNYKIDTQNNRLLKILQSGGSGEDWNGVRFTRGVEFED